MLFDAIVACIILKIFGVDGLKILGAVTMVTVLRTCHNINWMTAELEREIIENEEEN